jgi:hypothetical protein
MAMDYHDPRGALTPRERETLEQVRQRVVRAVPEIVYVQVFATIDVLLAAVDAHLTANDLDNPGLDFERLLKADNGDFWHDIGEVMRHADFVTGELRGLVDLYCLREAH